MYKSVVEYREGFVWCAIYKNKERCAYKIIDIFWKTPTRVEKALTKGRIWVNEMIKVLQKGEVNVETLG